jgi:hypothetical protein
MWSETFQSLPKAWKPVHNKTTIYSLLPSDASIPRMCQQTEKSNHDAGQEQSPIGQARVTKRNYHCASLVAPVRIANC